MTDHTDVITEERQASIGQTVGRSSKLHKRGVIVIHFSCDRCKRSIDPAEQLRYVVRIEVRAALDFDEPTDAEFDRDHLLDLEEILECAEDTESQFIGDDIYQQRTFDLCTDCYQKFTRNPVGRDSVELNFSEN